MPMLANLARAGRLSLGLIALAPLGAAAISVPALAQTPAADTDFVRSLGQRMVAVVNGDGSAADKKAAIQPMLAQDLDVNYIGRFCLGRYWNLATPAQQQRYLALFHQVLTNNIDDKLGEFRGVGMTVGDATVQNGQTYVSSIITRPNQPPATVQWVVSDATGSPKIVDVVAEGVRLSLTQRSDYASYLARNNNNVDALLSALQRQVGG